MNATPPFPPDAPPPVRQSRARIGCVVALVGIFGALVGLIWPICGAIQETQLQMHNGDQLRSIAAAFIKYRRSYHGEAPPRLADLSPYYAENPDDFGVPLKMADAVRQATGQAQRDLIDRHTSYRMIALADGRTVIYQDPDVPQRRNLVYCIIDNYQPGEKREDPAAVFVYRVNRDQFARDVAKGFPPESGVATPNPAPSP